MATKSKIRPDVPLPDDVLRTLVDALTTALLADVKLDVEATHDVGEDPEQDEALTRPAHGGH
jgi:hypothetical protein